METTLKVKRATVITSDGTDKVQLSLEAPSPFPEMRYAPYAVVEARQGYGVEWCKTVLGINPDVIHAESPRKASNG